jgi:peptide/nickel transport system ATP-binding protein/oligopeptide transport system ATP-binding protein
MSDILVQTNNLKKYFPVRQGFFQRVTGFIRAVDGVDLSIRRGSVTGIVGESGCGKSTIARLLCGLIPPGEGTVFFDSQNLYAKDAVKNLRRRMNIVFQDPFSSLNPRMTAAQLIGEPMQAYRLVKNTKERDCRAVYYLEKCGMFADQVYRYPHQFSGGQRQRICIARALAAESEFIVCDEAVSSLDVSIQAQIINLLLDLKEQRGLTYIFISHDLNVVRFISDEIAVMYMGQVAEYAPKETLFGNPAHPYTRLLLSATPDFKKQKRNRDIVSESEIPSLLSPPPGCRFCARCKEAMPCCFQEEPPVKEIAAGHLVKCHRAV